MKFGNTANKIKAIISVIRSGERINGRGIATRLIRRGYDVDESHINMFIYHYMLYKHLARERVRGTNYYYLNSLS